MVFDNNFGIIDKNSHREDARHTVKGVAFKGNRLLMLQSKQGDYSLPGGGIEIGETHHEALARELMEETGHRCNTVNELIGRTFLRKVDKFEPTEIYELLSFYYSCHLSDERGAQSLSVNEIAYGHEPIWVTLDEAISNNLKRLAEFDGDDYWLEQVEYVLLQIDKLMRG